MLLPTLTKELTLRQLQAELPEWEAFERFYHETMRQEVYRRNWLLEKLGSFILRRSGKKIRPLLLLYTARACGTPTQKTLLGATLIELLHNATLIHDDVVDESDYRRGFFSLRGLWGNRIAVLFGDWLLARGLLLALRYQEPQLLYFTSEAVEALVEGELLQLKRMRDSSITPETYFTVIEKKTAALFEATCKIGAWSADAPPALVEAAAQMGRAVGIAFQVRDDLLDWSDSALTGKPTDADRKQKRFTLPLLWALHQASPAERRFLQKAPFRAVRERLHALGAFTYSEQVLAHYTQQAMQLAQQLPNAHTLPFQALLHLLTYRSQ